MKPEITTATVFVLLEPVAQSVNPPPSKSPGASKFQTTGKAVLIGIVAALGVKPVSPVAHVASDVTLSFKVPAVAVFVSAQTERT